jgi:DNA-binding transcriptional regulator LsrR (DeoR family)
VLEMRETGMSQDAIASALGISRHQVRRLLGES